MNELMQFQFEGQQIRTVMQNGEPWFVAADVCRVLDQPNVSQVTARLEVDEKGLHNVDTPSGEQTVIVVNESGLYSLILTSRKPEAKAFKRWVTREVLPSIRKNGMYATDELLDNPDLLVEVATRLRDERRARLAAEATILQQKPMVMFAETCLASQDSILVRELAKLASKHGVLIGQNRLYEKLREWGLIIQGSTEPYQRAIDSGWFEVIQRPVGTPKGQRLTATTMVTPKGQMYIIERLRCEQAVGA